MLSKPENTRGTWSGLAILALGVAIGVLAHTARWLAYATHEREREPFPALVPAATPERPVENGLATLELVIPEASAAVLERVRARALEQGIITQTDADTVPAQVRFDGE